MSGRTEILHKWGLGPEFFATMANGKVSKESEVPSVPKMEFETKPLNPKGG